MGRACPSDKNAASIAYVFRMSGVWLGYVACGPWYSSYLDLPLQRMNATILVVLIVSLV